MNSLHKWSGRFGVIFGMFAVEAPAAPEKFDLRSVNGQSYVSSVKMQQGGTCWTHATMAAIESNLLVSGNWAENGEDGEPNLAEYHLDWWNGFNKNFNGDTSVSHGLTVHEGGDYRVAAAYLALGGAVREMDGQSYKTAPLHVKDTYHYYYPRNIEWLVSGNHEETVQRIKDAVQAHGVVGTALAWSDSLYNSRNGTFYQPATDNTEPNHAVSIVGWDDTKVTAAKKPGAWLIKNSWGYTWGQAGYFWLSYEDKTAGRHLDMGAVAFEDIEARPFDGIYSHDLHGWRDTLNDAHAALNVFTAKVTATPEYLKAVSFYTTQYDEDFVVRVFDSFDGNNLGTELASVTGHIANRGFHTVDLANEVALKGGKKFVVEVELKKGGHAFDKTSDVPVLLCGSNEKTIVKSTAKPGESFYMSKDGWVDLQKIDTSANFAIKALTVNESL